MATYCSRCQRSRDWPQSPVRPVRPPTACPLCGFEDPLGLYDYPDNLLPGMPNEVNAVAEREHGGGGGGGSGYAPATKGV